jgi:hypothetical protein
VIQVRSRGSFLFKALEAISVCGVLLAQDLDRDLAAEFHVFGKIDFAHPARAELFEYSIM